MQIAAVPGAGHAWSTSSASAKMAPQQKMSNLFDAIDTSNSGSITQSQFTNAFNTMSPPSVFKAQGAASVWSQLSPSGGDSVSKSDFINTMKQLMVSLRADSASTVNAGKNALG